LSEGRTPDGDLHWQKFSPPNPGVSNPAEIAVPTTSVPLIGITDVWRYHQIKEDLFTAWRNVGYVDTVAGWNSGGGLLYNETAALPAPRPSAGPGQHLRPGPTPPPCDTPTFYFRIHFTWPLIRDCRVASASDGSGRWAIVYLNGAQVFSLGMPAGQLF